MIKDEKLMKYYKHKYNISQDMLNPIMKAPNDGLILSSHRLGNQSHLSSHRVVLSPKLSKIVLPK